MKRKLLVAGPIALIVVIGVVAFVAWPRGGTAVTEDEAVERFRAAATTTSWSIPPQMMVSSHARSPSTEARRS